MIEALARPFEARVRRAWTRDRSALGLRALSVPYGLVVAARNALYDTGILRSRDASLPVVSVGGVTVGGSGKTPVAAHFARLLESAGHRPVILTHGYSDEVDQLRRALPTIAVAGDRDRRTLAEEAAAAGHTVAVLDDGFQYRRLARTWDLLLLDRDALRRTTGALLPAGPFRESWARALRRADAIVVTGREPWSEEVERFDAKIEERVRTRTPVPLASTRFDSDPPTPLNQAAADQTAPAPELALTGIMKPNLFFEHARRHCRSIRAEVALPDHGRPGRGDLGPLRAAAGEGGVLITDKDQARLEAIFGTDTPVWVLPERLTWLRGRDAVEAGLAEAVPAPTTGHEAVS